MTKTQRNFDIEISSRDGEKLAQAKNKITDLEASGKAVFFEKTYYQPFSMFDGTSTVKPDHHRFAIESIPDLKHIKPLILENVDIQNIRYATNYVLAFVQNIPYSALQSRVSSSGAGFNPPAKLLWENQGDCDSKVTLTSSFLRSLMPRVKIAMIFIDGHALIAIEVKDQEVSQDETINIGGDIYSLAEPTGPALLPLGQIALDSLQAIRAGHYTVEFISEN